MATQKTPPNHLGVERMSLYDLLLKHFEKENKEEEE